MNLTLPRANEPTDPGWLAINHMLNNRRLYNEADGEALRSEMLAAHIFSSVGFCTTSVQAFSSLHKNIYVSSESLRGVDFHTFAQKLSSSERAILGRLIARAPAARKASKTGDALAELARRAGPFGAETSACVLNAMALSFSYSSCTPFSIESRAELLGLAARRARTAWPALLASAVCRACHESDASLLTELLDGLGPDSHCFGVAPLGSTPLCLSIQRAGHNLRGHLNPFACAEILLARGADPNERDAEGKTPLSYAARSNSLPACTLLLAAGADPWMVACTPQGPLKESSPSVPENSTCVDIMRLKDSTRDLALSLTESRVLDGVSLDRPRTPSPRI